MNIYVGGLPFSLEETELQGFFQEYGEVSSAKIITDKFSGRSKGFGFVEMPDDAAAQKAIDELNGSEISGRTITVNKAEEKKAGGGGGGRNFRGGGSGGGGNRGGGGGGGFNKGGYRDSGRRNNY